VEGGKGHAPPIMIVHKTTQYAQNMGFASVQHIGGEVLTVGDKEEEGQEVGEEGQHSPHAPPAAIVLPVLLSVLSMAFVSVLHTGLVDQNVGSKETVVVGVDLEDQTMLEEEGDMEVGTM
jgi:hypothetical protein